MGKFFTWCQRHELLVQIVVSIIASLIASLMALKRLNP